MTLPGAATRAAAKAAAAFSFSLGMGRKGGGGEHEHAGRQGCRQLSGHGFLFGLQGR